MKKIVIIGGGFAGAYCAKKLERNFEVTLIDTKDYFEFTPGILRTLVEPKHVKNIQVLHSHYLHQSKIVRGHVTSVDESFVFINKKKFAYDYLIISSGSKYNAPFKAQDVVIATRADELRESHRCLEKAHSLLIIGGGIVGVELAAELAEHCKDKTITLLQRGDTLLARCNPRTIAYAERFLKNKGVEIHYHQFWIGSKHGNFYTKERDVFKADMGFLCTGIKPNSDFLKKIFSKLISPEGYLEVNDFLQLNTYKNIFLIGDVAGIKEEKLAQNAEHHAKIAVENIYRLEHRKDLIPYVSKPRMMVISLGKRNGILMYKNFCLTGFIPGLFKSFIEWKTMRRYAY